MDRLEDFLAGDEEDLCSYSAGDLEEMVLLLSSQVRTHQEELNKTKGEIQELEAETTQRTLSRDLCVSRRAQTLDLLEALEEEEKTQQQLRAIVRDTGGVSAARSPECSEALESRLKEVEDLVSTYCQQEKDRVEEVRSLKTSLEEARAALEEAKAEHQTVESELLALQSGLSAQSRPAQGEAARVLSACIQEITLLNLLPGKRLKK